MNLNKKIILVLDTSAFLAKYHLQISKPDIEIYTTTSVVNEVRDKENREALNIGLSIGRVKIVEPNSNVKNIVLDKARRIGEKISLSSTDLDIAGLAYMLKDQGKVVVITDDYSLQNLLYHLGISFKPLRTHGIERPRKYIVYCKACGYVSRDRDEEFCPICGAKLVRRKQFS